MNILPLSAMLVILGLQTACVSAPDRKVGYGGRAWSLAEIFPEGPNRDLAAAAAAGSLRGIDRALKAGADINFRGTHCLTPLWWASWDQNLRGFTYLLERGADPNVVPTESWPLMYLIADAMWPVGFLKAALAHGGNPNLPDRQGATPLHRAMVLGTREHFDALLAAGAFINKEPGSRSYGPMLGAVTARRYEYVLRLLELGADPRERDNMGYDLATRIGMAPFDPNSKQWEWRERVIRFLRKEGIEAHPPSNEGPRTAPLPSDLR